MENSFYRKTLTDLFERQSHERVSNGATENISVVYATMLEFAKDKFWLYIKTLNKEIFDDKQLIRNLNGAINRGVSVQVWCKTVDDGLEFEKILNETEGDDCFIKKLPEDYDFKNMEVAIMDRKGIRYKNLEEDRSFVCANEAPFVEIVCHSFENLKEKYL